MPAFSDITGQRFHRLVAMEPTTERRGGKVIWKCKCDCGNITYSVKHDMVSGKKQSCGCKLSENTAKRNYKHGDYGSPTYRSWQGMVQRCTDKQSISYQYYGGRGVEVCDRWRDYRNFLADMGERPKGRSIDRIDNSGDYEPGNCRWATASEQMKNRRKWNVTAKGPDGRFIKTKR